MKNSAIAEQRSDAWSAALADFDADLFRRGAAEKTRRAYAIELRDRALFELAYASGLRAEELVQLDVGALDHDRELIRVEGKGSKTRLVPVGEHALAALERYRQKARPALSVGDGERALFLSKS